MSAAPAAVPVLCFPFAGAGASVFRRCQENAPDAVRVQPVQLPGREDRFGEPLQPDVPQQVEGLLPQMLDLIGSARTVALFGHSFGAVLAYEAAHRLSALDGLVVAQVLVSGSPGPWTKREDRASGLSDEEFLARVREFAGYAHPALEHPELREMLLPTLRADVEMHEAYLAPSDRPLDAPITSIRGVDDELVTPEQAAEWAVATTRGCRLVDLPGNHMYFVDSPVELVALMAEVLSGEPVRG
ncbi:MAG: thioesterase II family protein [Frankiaceae bacterium]